MKEGSDSSSGVSSGSGTAMASPRAFQRRWAPADEISLLEAAASHRQRHGGMMPSPGDLAAALRGRLLTEDHHLDARAVSRQLASLRRRYAAAWRRLSSRGVVPVKDHDLRIYRLSKSLWEGSRGCGARKPIARHEARELGELEALYPCLSAEVEAVEASRPCAVPGVFRRSFRRIGDEKAAELEAKAKRLRLAELKVGVRLDMLRKEVAETILELID
uniref:Glabrous enhancer-binding protein-like DBD domain-containing protein n=1 Tax=Oryza rufipogon TaxID=4529 RepID=A0A0E0PY99_ORYRU